MTNHVTILAGCLALLVATASSAEDKVDFEKQIQPIFLEHCAKCHGESKNAGKMRLNTADAVQEKWNDVKDLFVPGDPDKSKLYQRLVLPADSPKRMPKGADPLAKEQIELIARWIKEGAVLKTAAAAAVSAATATTTKDAKTEEAKPAAAPEQPPLPQVAAAPQEAIDKLTKAGARVMPLFAGSALLDVSFAGRGEPAADADVALLAGVAEQVYALNLADAKLTDAGLAPIAGLKNLSTLHLERSNVTDDGLAHVGALPQLQYLNVYGTGVSDAGLKHLSALKHLGRLYLWHTKVSYDAAMAMEQDIPGLIVNVGFDHPVVAKKRLTKELETAKKLRDEAKADVEKLKQREEQAAKDAEAAAARVTDLEKQLMDLEKPADGS